MLSLQFLSFALVCIAFHVVQTGSFSLPRRQLIRIRVPRTCSAQTHCSGRPLRYQRELDLPSRFMTTTDDQGDRETEEREKADETSETKEPEAPEKGVAWTVLLTIPLFVKFVAVLLIKFVTDLIVFPALFLYRLAHNGKIKLLQLFRSNDKSKPNGEVTPE